MEFPNYQPDFNQRPSQRQKIFFAWFGASILIIAGFVVYHWASDEVLREITIYNNQPTIWNKVANLLTFLPIQQDDPDYVMPIKEPSRLDVLVMGIRGKDDLADGGLLTDTILLFSFDRTTGKASLVSIPRDLYVTISSGKKDKLNTAYERLGLGGAKKLFSKITGVYVDNAVVFNFTAFEKIIDTLGGVDITLDKPFEEKQQWGYTFALPAGLNHLDGQNALYYARSRYSTSDFDRAARQQQLILAIKQKILATDFISDPLKALSLINAIRSNIVTDFNILDTTSLLDLAHQIDTSTLKRYVLTTDNFLYDTHAEDGAYILLPRGGHLDQIKKLFTGLPHTIATPVPTPSESPKQ